MQKYRRLHDKYATVRKQVANVEVKLAEAIAINASSGSDEAGDKKLKKRGSFRGGAGTDTSAPPSNGIIEKSKAEMKDISSEMNDLSSDLLIMESNAVKVVSNFSFFLKDIDTMCE